MVRRGGALPRPRATERVAPTEGAGVREKRGHSFEMYGMFGYDFGKFCEILINKDFDLDFFRQ